MKSMTGFGRGAATGAGMTFIVEITSVNRKQTDIRLSLPGEMTMLEPILRGMIGERIERGAINVKVTVNPTDAAAGSMLKINEPLLQALAENSRRAAARLGLGDDIGLRDLLALPGVIELKEPDCGASGTEEAFRGAVDAALDGLMSMKRSEGETLRADIAMRLEILSRTLDKIEPLAADIPRLQKDKLLQRLERAGLPLEMDDERILREIVIFCDRADVSEEITRLRSHFVQFEDMIGKDGDAVGRGLDFLIQELNRELCTLGNKAAGGEISPLIVKMKTELEKIREQVQNIE